MLTPKLLTVEDFFTMYYAYGLFEARSTADGKLLFTSRSGKAFDRCRKCKVYDISPQIRLHKDKDSSYAVLVIYINTATWESA